MPAAAVEGAGGRRQGDETNDPMNVPSNTGTSRARSARIPSTVAATAAVAIAICGCGGSGGATAAQNSKKTTSTPSYAGVTASPQRPAPPLALSNSLGKPVNIRQYRGKAVLVTFIYDHCPDVCPIIVGNLHTAQSELGPAAKDVQIIAVSVDPKGDTPKTVKAFLKAHRMTGRMQYLIGSRPQLERTWQDWNIVSKASKSKKDPDAVEHSALIYGIDASGRITTLYPANFKPSQIVHDVPILASR